MESGSSSVSEVHSESGSTEVEPKLKEDEEVSSEKNIETEMLKRDPVKDVQFVAMDSLENKEKYEKYAADYSRYLTDKYFSNKTIFGCNIYDVKGTTIDGQTVRSSGVPPYQSYLDPAGFHDMLMNSALRSKKEENPADSSSVTQSTKTSN